MGRTIINMVVELENASFESKDEASVLEHAGAALTHARGARPDELAWIAHAFGGKWPDEAAAGWNWFAKTGDQRTVGFATYEQRACRWPWLERWLDRADVGIFGPMGVDSSMRGKSIGRILLRRALASLQACGFKRALIGAVGPVEFYERWAGAHVVERLVL